MKTESTASFVARLAVTLLLRRLVSLDSWFRLIGFCAVTGCIGVAVNLLVAFSRTERSQFIRSLLRKIRKV